MEDKEFRGQIIDFLIFMNPESDEIKKRCSSYNSPPTVDEQRKAYESMTTEELMDYLCVYIKHQVFDVEASRRENTYLRKIIEQNL